MFNLIDSNMNDNFNPENSLDYMFDVPEEWNIPQIMLSTKNLKFNEIRNTFYNSDLSSLEGFSVITNVHAFYKLGNNWNSLVGLDYIPTTNDINIVKERIIERAKTSKQIIKYYGKNIIITEYIAKLK